MLFCDALRTTHSRSRQRLVGIFAYSENKNEIIFVRTSVALSVSCVDHAVPVVSVLHRLHRRNRRYKRKYLKKKTVLLCTFFSVLIFPRATTRNGPHRRQQVVVVGLGPWSLYYIVAITVFRPLPAITP